MSQSIPVKRSLNRDGEKIHKDGRQAYADGFGVHMNPYERCTDTNTLKGVAYVSWGNGWRFAKFTDESGKVNIEQSLWY